MFLKVGSRPLATETHRVARRCSRMLFSVPITLHYLMAGRLRESHGISLDISEGGLGALVEGRLHTGEAVEVFFSLTGLLFNTVAIVRHSSSSRCGFEFLGLTSQERSKITSLTGSS